MILSTANGCQSFFYDLQGAHTKTDLEKNLYAHSENTVHDTEGKDKRHRIYIQTQEPRKGSDGNLDVDRFEVFVDHGETSMNEGFENSLVQESTFH